MADRTIFLARHGSRIDSEDPGWAERAENPYDPNLSVTGAHEAHLLAQRMAGERISSLYSSPYLRTVQTAHICAKALGLPVRVEAGFGEWLNPRWFTHRPRTSHARELKRQFQNVDEYYLSVVDPVFPETWEEAFDRFGRAIDLVLRQTEGAILIVGHGATIEGVIGSLLHGRFFNTSADPASLFRLDLQDGAWNPVFRNDISHLR
ncbi:MAG: histidine phosphatase family protein [Desulfobacteraceae bacterium]|nr:MAG: histidine phosphatase family protein [Desulfobacteraceae bacterium]